MSSNFATFQFLLAFASATILSKFIPFTLFFRWLASYQILCYKIPTSQELWRLKAKPTQRQAKGKKSRQPQCKKETLDPDQTPNDFDLTPEELNNYSLKQGKLTLVQLLEVPYSDRIEWLIDLSFMSIVSYIIIQLKFSLSPEASGYNFGTVWLILVLTYCIKLLFEILRANLTRNNGEPIIILVTFVLFFLISMYFLTLGEETFYFGIEPAYELFKETLAKANFHDEKGSVIVSLATIKILLAITSAIIACLMVFPSFAFGRVHRTAIEHPKIGILKQSCMGLNFLGPIIVSLLWIGPVKRGFMTKIPWFSMDNENFNAFRIYVALLFSLYKIYLIPHYLKAYLGTFQEVFRRTSFVNGKKRASDIRELFRNLYRKVGYILCIYLGPTLLCMFVTLLYMTLGNFSMIPNTIKQSYFGFTVESSPSSDLSTTYESTTQPVDTYEDALLQKIFSMKSLASPVLFRGLLGYIFWWVHFSCFSQTTVALVYYQNMIQH